MVKASDLLRGGGTPFKADDFAVPGTFNWTVPAGVTRILVYVLGAGGSGAATRSPTKASTRGGGGGGFTMGRFDVTPGNTYTVVVAAGGPFRAAGSGPIAGVDGGSSSLTGIGIALAASGGQGGGYNLVAPLVAAGGLGSGGAQNYSGGSGGSSGNGIRHASGGGAAGSPFGNGGKGGDVSSNNLGADGGAVGALDGVNNASGVGKSPPRQFRAVISEAHPGLFGTPLQLVASPNGGTYAVDPYGRSYPKAAVTQDSDGFAGGTGSANNGAATAGDGGEFGGGGGAASNDTSSSAGTSGSGGNGYVSIVYDNPDSGFII